MSEYTVLKIPATPMDAIKQIYELFQTRRNFTTSCLARNRWDIQVASNDADACRWCLSGAVFRVYNLDADIAYKSAGYKLPEELADNLSDTVMLLWEKLPANLKFGGPNIPIWCYIDGIAIFNNRYGYAGVMRLLQAVIDDTEYKWEA